MLTPATLGSDLSGKLISLLERPPSGPAGWQRRMARLEEEHGPEVYHHFFHVLTSLTFSAKQSKSHWHRVLKTWEALARSSGDAIDLRVAVLHYFLHVQGKLKNPAIVEFRILKQAKDSITRDELTKIYNYRYFQERLEQEVQRIQRYERALSLLMIDIDDFKLFNDRNGHLGGNVALARLARIFSGCVRQVDVVCRYGGEEFAILLPATPRAGGLIVAEKIRLKVEKAKIPGRESQPTGVVTVSVGLATLPMDASNADDLVASADSALYRAKAAGKNRVESCSDERRGNARYAARLPGRLRVLDQTALAVNTLDISEGGFLFSAPRALPVGGLVLLELTLPGRRTLDCTARVVRVIEREQDHELGVKVIHAEGVHLNRLRSLVATLRREKSGEGRSAGTTVRLTRRQRHGA